MTVITTSIGSTIIVKETMEEVIKAINNKNIATFTLIDNSHVGVSVKHIVNIKK